MFFTFFYSLDSIQCYLAYLLISANHGFLLKNVPKYVCISNASRLSTVTRELNTQSWNVFARTLHRNDFIWHSPKPVTWIIRQFITNNYRSFFRLPRIYDRSIYDTVVRHNIPTRNSASVHIIAIQIFTVNT